MASVVTEPCRGCKYTDCVVVCPVDAFYEGEQMLFIHPEECICCEACLPECPISAIFSEENVPEVWNDFIALNREMSAICPPITAHKEPLANRPS
jgi:ferredoxin